MSTVELAIGFLFPVIIMIVGYWKEEVWLFYMASALWLIFMGFLFNNYNSTEFLYYVAWTLLIPAIVCATAQLWMNKGKPTPTLDEKDESLEERRESRAKKIEGLKGLRDRMRGR